MRTEPIRPSSFDEIAAGSARFAHWLERNGIQRGDRIAFMLEPSLPFYLSLFGAMMMGAISVPLFTLFGLDGLKLRIDDCKPKLLITNAEKAPIAKRNRGICASSWPMPSCSMRSRACRPRYRTATRAEDMAVFQYTSGTTRELPAAVKHSHRTVVTLMFAALYGTGIRPGDEFFCPSSPAWGHGLWHGTLAPLALGVTTGTFAGRFDAVRLMKALQDYRITNLSAAATHYRMMKNSGKARDFAFSIKKLSYTGEPIDAATLEFIDETFHVPACSMYGTTEIGVVLVNYPGASDYVVKPGSLGKAVPGLKLEVQKPDGTPAEPGVVGELMLWRRDRWETTKDLAKIDEDGYFYHAGRADDVIISAGWTMSAVEIENTLLKHPECEGGGRHRRAGCDARSGRKGVHRQPTDPPSEEFVDELKNFTRGAAEPARISASHRLRGRASQNAGGQGSPQDPSRARSRGRDCDTENIQETTNANHHQTHTATASPRSRRRASTIFASASACRLPTRSSRGITRRPATAFVIMLTASATITRCGPIRPMRKRRAMEPSWRCRAFCSRPAASCRVIAAVSRASTPCGRVRNGRGTRTCCAATRISTQA